MEGAGLRIVWSDGQTAELSSEALRTNCPCAGCREKRGDQSHAAPIQKAPSKKNMLKIVEASLEDELKLLEVWAVGNYAVGLSWGDGHNTGIYTFAYLEELQNLGTPTPS
ncbi:MAG: DUF971 domain-containing protein [Oligoflexia bacterium]|nr:DUF971 domain-containing protein [Oligoflexia bacterium]